MLARSAGLSVLVLLLVAPAAWADAGGDGASYLGRVVGEDVRLRTGPSRNHRVVELVGKGELLLVQRSAGDWLKVRMPGGVLCWVREDLLTVRGDEAVVARTRVLMRPTAGQDYLPLDGRLEQGEKLRVVSRKEKPGGEPAWIQLLAPDRVPVYIHGQYVARAGDAPADLTALGKARVDRLLDRRRAEKAGDTAARRDDALRVRVRKVQDALGKLGEGPGAEAEVARLKAELETVLSEAEFRLTKVEAAGVYKDILLLEKRLELAQAKTEAELTEEELRAKIREADENYRKSVGDLAKLAPVREMQFTSIGWIQRRRGAWVIEKGGIPLYVVTSRLFAMKDFVGKKVGIRGQMVGEDPARGVRILDVEAIEIFSN